MAAGDLVEPAGEQQSPEELLAFAEERQRLVARVEAAMARLDEIDRRLVRACHWEDLSVAEAARRAGVEYDHARYRYNVAMAALERDLTAAARVRSRAKP